MLFFSCSYGHYVEGTGSVLKMSDVDVSYYQYNHHYHCTTTTTATTTTTTITITITATATTTYHHFTYHHTSSSRNRKSRMFLCPQDAAIFENYRLLNERGQEQEKMERLSVLGLRYFTPREVANLQCLPQSFGEYQNSFIQCLH